MGEVENVGARRRHGELRSERTLEIRMTESADDNIVDSVDDDISMHRNNCNAIYIGTLGSTLPVTRH